MNNVNFVIDSLDKIIKDDYNSRDDGVLDEEDYGEIVEFELFSATLSRSRLHRFIISFSKTNEAFMRCLIDTFTYIGGLVDEVLTDNMKAIVNIVGNSITSLIDSDSVKSIHNLSIPYPIPPAGGIPYSRASMKS